MRARGELPEQHIRRGTFGGVRQRIAEAVERVCHDVNPEDMSDRELEDFLLSRKPELIREALANAAPADAAAMRRGLERAFGLPERRTG